MTTYRLRLKNSEVINESEREKYNITQLDISHNYLMLDSEGYSLCGHNSGYYISGESEFTKHEIDLIPNGLFKKFDVIEIEEDKYNIICPLTSCYLVIDKDNNKTRWINTDYCEDNDLFQKQFTKSEIEGKFKCYANETFMIKNSSK